MREIACGDFVRFIGTRAESSTACVNPLTKKPLAFGDIVIVKDLPASVTWSKAVVYQLDGGRCNVSGKSFVDAHAFPIDCAELIGTMNDYFILRENPPAHSRHVGKLIDNGRDRFLQAGDIIKGNGFTTSSLGDQPEEYFLKFNGTQYVSISCLAYHEGGETDECKCDTRNLMLAGCTCGYMKRVKLRKEKSHG